MKSLKILLKTSVEVWKIAQENSPKNLNQNWPKTLIYKGFQKLAVGARLACRSTGRSTDQQSYLWPLGFSVDRSVDRGKSQRAKLFGAVDWDQIHRVNSLDRSTARSTGPQARACACFCAHRSTAWSTDFWLGRPVGRPPEGQVRDN